MLFNGKPVFSRCMKVFCKLQHTVHIQVLHTRIRAAVRDGEDLGMRQRIPVGSQDEPEARINFSSKPHRRVMALASE